MRAGKRDIVASGSIVTQAGDTSVELEHANLRFKLVFEQIDGRPAEVVGKNEDSLVTFTFTNTENSLGMHWSSVVAASGDKALYLAVYLFTLGETGKWSRLINYTFSEEKP